MGCTAVNTEFIPGCSVKGKTIVKSFGDGLFIFWQKLLPLVLSLGAFGMVIYLAYQYRSRLPALNWMYARSKKDEMENES